MLIEAKDERRKRKKKNREGRGRRGCTWVALERGIKPNPDRGG